MIKPYLTYYPVPGKGELIRMMLSHHQVNYEEGYKGYHERESYEFGQIPVLDIDGRRLAQTKAILDYLSKKYGLFPSSPPLFIKVKFLADVFGEMRQALKDYVIHAQDRKTTVPLFFNRVVPGVLQILKETLEANGSKEYLVGTELTVADLLFCEFIFETVINRTNQFGTYKLGRA